MRGVRTALAVVAAVLGIAAAGLAHRAHLGHPLGSLVGLDEDEVQLVGEAHGQADHARPAGGDEDGRAAGARAAQPRSSRVSTCSS